MLEAASRESALVVTSRRGRGGFAGSRGGSVTRALAAHTRRRLALIPGVMDSEVAEEVVVGAGPRHSAAAIRYAFEAARGLGAPVTAARAWWPVTAATTIAGPAYVGDAALVQQDASDALEEAIAPMRAEFSDVRTRTVVREGDTVDVLAGVARRAHLLVAGSRSARALCRRRRDRAEPGPGRRRTDDQLTLESER